MSSGSRRVDPPHMVSGLRTREWSFHTAFETDLYHHGERAVSRPSSPSRGWPQGCPRCLPGTLRNILAGFLPFCGSLFLNRRVHLLCKSLFQVLNRRSIQECISAHFRQVSVPGFEQTKHSGMHLCSLQASPCSRF